MKEADAAQASNLGQALRMMKTRWAMYASLPGSVMKHYAL
jgi:hypothetical protein